MLKATVIIGIILSIGGGLLLGWASLQPQRPADLEEIAYAAAQVDVNTPPTPQQDWSGLAIDNNEALHSELVELRSKTPEQQSAEKWSRFMADLDKLVAGETPDLEIAATLYPANWQTHVQAYRQHKENREILLTAAVVVTGLGAVTVVLCLLTGICRLLFHRKPQESPASELEVDHDCPVAKGAIKDLKLDETPTETDPLSQRTKLDTHREQAPARSKVSVDIPKPEEAPSEPDMADFKRVYPNYDHEDASDLSFSSTTTQVQNLMADEKDEPLSPQEGPILPSQDANKQGIPATPAPVSAPVKAEAPAPVAASVPKNQPTNTSQGTIADQTQQLAEQIAQVAQQTQDKETAEAAEPVNETLAALSDQISAIRQYAASQQDRVEKLQSGYDWNIIRTFCVRVIRCIDNLETRISRCEDEEMAQELGEVHDELLFSLESSGVEQFAPDINSAFSGQERLAEAVKEKVTCPKPNLKGCIAQVVKPGYQYVIDDDNVKIVRTARVKLYGDAKAIQRED